MGGVGVVRSTFVLPGMIVHVPARRRYDLPTNVTVVAYQTRHVLSGDVLRVRQQAIVSSPAVAGFVGSYGYRA